MMLKVLEYIGMSVDEYRIWVFIFCTIGAGYIVLDALRQLYVHPDVGYTKVLRAIKIATLVEIRLLSYWIWFTYKDSILDDILNDIVIIMLFIDFMKYQSSYKGGN
jgi:hypothetical protein